MVDVFDTVLDVSFTLKVGRVSLKYVDIQHLIIYQHQKIAAETTGSFNK